MPFAEHHRIILTIPEPFHFSRTVAKPATWHWSTPEEMFHDGILWTGVYVGDVPLGLKMSAVKNKVNVTVFSDTVLTSKELSLLQSTIWSGLGGDEDLAGFYQFARNDMLLSETIERLFGMRLATLDDVPGRTFLAILLQMAPMKRSDQMITALLHHFGNRIEFDGKMVILWPRPRDLSSVDVDDLRKKANLGYRAGRLIQAARFLAETPITLRSLSTLPEKEAIAELTRIPGVGDYSAGIILGKTSLPLDVWSVVIMSELVLGRTPENPREAISGLISVLTERWGRWRWYAFVYLLNDLENLSKTYRLSRIG